jgi:hypothetical protein
MLEKKPVSHKQATSLDLSEQDMQDIEENTDVAKCLIDNEN